MREQKSTSVGPLFRSRLPRLFLRMATAALAAMWKMLRYNLIERIIRRTAAKECKGLASERVSEREGIRMGIRRGRGDGHGQKAALKAANE